jgi:carboxymethylenebutenolidase
MKRMLIALLISYCFLPPLFAQSPEAPDTVSVVSGSLTLKGVLWKPNGRGPFPTILFAYGNIPSNSSIGPELANVFVKNGYNFFVLYRRGVGLSIGEGQNSRDLMDKAFTEKGEEGRNIVQLEQLQANLQDMSVGLTFLRGRKYVDPSRIAIVGHSFGGQLAYLLAEQDHELKAVVSFAAAANGWNRSPALQTRIITAVKNITAPVMIIYAQNDNSTTPGYAVDSVMNQLGKPHILKIYPPIGNSAFEGHHMIFTSISTWESDVLNFLKKNLQ